MAYIWAKPETKKIAKPVVQKQFVSNYCAGVKMRFQSDFGFRLPKFARIQNVQARTSVYN